MKCPRYDTTRVCNVERSADNVAAFGAKVAHVKSSPVKEPLPIKPHCPPPGVTKVLFSLNNDTRAFHNKENSTHREHDRTLDEALEDSGYLSLHNSQIDDHHGDEEDQHTQGRTKGTLLAAAHQERTLSPNNSPSKCSGGHRVSVVAASTPVDRPRRRILSSTPQSDPNLTICKFQRAVCDELAKSYQKNKRYDWSIVTKVAEDHLLDRVIGAQMGREYVDVFVSLLSRNMRSILGNILALLGHMDLISCKKVSRTWRKIICEDSSSTKRCLQAEQELRESTSSLGQKDCGLTRDVAMSRVVLSCMQTRASSTVSSSSSSSSSTSPRVVRRTTPSQKGNTPQSKCTRFTEFVQAASSLKQHESLRSCKRCGSPATHSAETQRATCTRLNCLFDFCTCCQETFHGSTPCRTVQSRSHFAGSKATPILPGSARSKRNVRRL